MHVLPNFQRIFFWLYYLSWLRILYLDLCNVAITLLFNHYHCHLYGHNEGNNMDHFLKLDRHQDNQALSHPCSGWYPPVQTENHVSLSVFPSIVSLSAFPSRVSFTSLPFQSLIISLILLSRSFFLHRFWQFFPGKVLCFICCFLSVVRKIVGQYLCLINVGLISSPEKHLFLLQLGIKKSANF